MPYIEERIENLEKEIVALKDEVGYWRAKGSERFVTMEELSNIMKCSKQTISRRIKEGEIFATDVGGPRIPMSQFYENEAVKRQADEKIVEIRRAIFG
ncbi:MAG: hypothetical protein ACOX1S_05480 [Anaerostipes sp.]|jgi:Fic family protein|nr:hypothetical protein [Anaerostipes sp.]